MEDALSARSAHMLPGARVLVRCCEECASPLSIARIVTSEDYLDVIAFVGHVMTAEELKRSGARVRFGAIVGAKDGPPDAAFADLFGQLQGILKDRRHRTQVAMQYLFG